MNKWYRSVDDRMLGGVCGGIAEALGVDVLLVRLFFIAATAVSGLGIVLYAILWITTPPETLIGEASKEEISKLAREEIKEKANEIGRGLQDAVESDDPNVRMVARWALAILIGLGANKLRRKRQPAAPTKGGHRAGLVIDTENGGDDEEATEPEAKVEVQVEAEVGEPEPEIAAEAE